MKLFIICCLFWSVDATGQEDWELAKSKKGIKVYVSPVRGSSYFAYKAETVLPASIKDVAETLRNIDRYIHWFAFTAKTTSIKSTDSKELFFMETDYPWPYSNECMHYLMEFNPPSGNIQRIKISGIKGNSECEYSLKKANGYITMESKGSETKVVYYFHCEPSQNIPPWLINPRIHEMPYQTLIGLREELER